jgi:hypothetical protein
VHNPVNIDRFMDAMGLSEEARDFWRHKTAGYAFYAEGDKDHRTDNEEPLKDDPLTEDEDGGSGGDGGDGGNGKSGPPPSDDEKKDNNKKCGQNGNTSDSAGDNMPIIFLFFIFAINMLDLVSRNNNAVIPVLLLANKNKYPSFYIA